jgi:hypothetical protein
VNFGRFFSVLARISGLTFSLGTLCQYPVGLGGLLLRFGAVLGVFDPSKRLWKVPRTFQIGVSIEVLLCVFGDQRDHVDFEA